METAGPPGKPVFAHAPSQNLATSQAACDHLWEVLSVIPASMHGPGLSFVGLHRPRLTFLYGRLGTAVWYPPCSWLLQEHSGLSDYSGVASVSVLKRGESLTDYPIMNHPFSSQDSMKEIIQKVLETSHRGHGLGSVSASQGGFILSQFSEKRYPESHCSQRYWVFEHYKYEFLWETRPDPESSRPISSYPGHLLPA